MQLNGGAPAACVPAAEPDGRLRPPAPINDWIFQKPGATIDTPANLKAAQHLEKWIKAGYFPPTPMRSTTSTMMSRFIGGEGLFMFNGDWESGNLDKQMRRQCRLLPDAAG